MSNHRLILITSLAAAIAALPFSVTICHAALGIYLLAWLLEGSWSKKWRLLQDHPVVWVYSAMFILHLIGTTYSGDTSNAWFNVEKKVVLLLLPATLVTTMNLQKEDLKILSVTFIGACLAASIVCVIAALAQNPPGMDQINFDNVTWRTFIDQNPASSPWWMPFSYIQLASGIGMHPTFLAMYVLFSIGLFLHLLSPSFPYMSNSGKVASIILLAWLSIFVYLLSSRIIIVAILLAAIILLSRRKAMASWAGGLMLLAFMGVFISNPVNRYRNWQEIITPSSYQPVDGLYSFSTGIRLSLWQSATEAIKNGNPLTGAGTGDVEDSMLQALTALHAGNSIHSFDPHNEFMFMQIALGLPGLICWMLCLALPAWTAFQQKDFIFLFLVLMFSLVCLTESALESQKGIVFFTLFVSLFSFKHRSLSPQASMRQV